MSYFSDFWIGVRLASSARYRFLCGASLLVVALSALLSAQFSGRQPATVALDVGISIVRLILPLVLVLLSQELLSREFDKRYFLTSLTYPRSREKLLFGRFLAVSLLTLFLSLVLAIVLALLVMLIGHGYAQSTPVALGYNYMVVFFFIGLEVILLAALSCLLAVVASTPSFVLIGTLGFMLVARSFSAIVELLARDASLVSDAEIYRGGLGLLSYFLPDLGALDVRNIALYGRLDFLPVDWPLLVVSSALYAAAIIALATWILQHKRFA